LGAWILLFGSLALCAGHGLFLFVALRETDLLSDAGALGGTWAWLVMGWFVACVPLTILSVALRRALMRMALLTPAAVLAALVSAGTFGLYLLKIVR
jgi:hypothetical protein